MAARTATFIHKEIVGPVLVWKNQFQKSKSKQPDRFRM
jgi:hypothetical protein